MKTRRLTAEEHRARLSMGVCPRCGDYRLVRIVRMKQAFDGSTPTFSGAFWACGGPEGHLCYHLSSETGTYLSESAEGNTPVRLPPSSGERPRVIRRPKAAHP